MTDYAFPEVTYFYAKKEWIETETSPETKKEWMNIHWQSKASP